MNYFLGIETSQSITSIAVSQETNILGARHLSLEQNQRSRLLVAEIKLLLNEHAIMPQELACIFVSLGPGSFTGLRIGIIVAKTMAFAAGVKVKGVPSFQIVADQITINNEPLIVVSDAQRGDVFWQQFRAENDRWRALSDLSIVNWQRMSEEYSIDSQQHPTITGPALSRFELTANSHLSKAESDKWFPSANQTILTGIKELEQASYDDLFQLAPIYVRPSSAEEKSASSPGAKQGVT